MQWFRARTRFGAWAALAALLFQLVVSAGHVHPDYFGLANASAQTNLRQSPDAAGFPLRGGTQDPAGAVCDICATLALLGTAQISAPPSVLVDFVAVTAATAEPTASAPAKPRSVHFRSRAPPVA
jgi:hypothetical protein